MSAESLAGLSINTATTRRQWNLEQAVSHYARLGVAGIAPWRDQVDECGLTRAAQVIRESGLRVTGLCRGGMFPVSDQSGREAAIDDNRRAIEQAHELSADCLVLVCGGLPLGSRDLSGARDMIFDGLSRILPEARAAGVKLAIEPLHPMYAADRNCINTIAQANKLCCLIDPGSKSEPCLGIALDVYHVWWDPNLRNEIQRVEPGRLHAFHICDWTVPTKDLLNDRGMMGDGVVDLARITKWVRDRGFLGLPEVEIFSNYWWDQDPEDVVRLCLKRSLPIREVLASSRE